MGPRACFVRNAGTLLISLALAGAAFGQASSWDAAQDNWDAVTFSHKLHVQELETECEVCHAEVESSVASQDLLLPTMDVCSDCHDVENEDDCLICHTSEDRMAPFTVPERKIVFSHSAHLARKAECATCHAGIEEAESSALNFLPAMKSCNACHNSVETTGSCETCHTQVEVFLPETHRSADWLRQHKRQARAKGMSDDCSVCHADNFCQSCHAGTTLESTREAPIRIISGNRPMAAGRRAMVKQSVHDLNYVFSHALDFRSRKSDCLTCHNQHTFCSECHEKDQDAGFHNPMPLSHQQADFVRIGVGSGGGGHAKQARRDIASCAACHDVEGRDAACITCHVDRLPGKGNDPKTHSARFENMEGEWHSNEGAVCYNCHTSTNTAGIGFCGYCHGMK